MKACLILEDGSIFTGKSFAGSGKAIGEVIFNTSMTGYQEIITDPSYKEQIVILTYPLIGNYGINKEDVESSKIHVKALIIKEYQNYPSNWRSEMSLGDYLNKNGIIGIEGIDTRALTRHLRLKGTMIGLILVSDYHYNSQKLIYKTKKFQGLIGQDLVKKVTCQKKINFFTSRNSKLKVVVFDFGIKLNILNILTIYDCNIIIVPAITKADEIRKIKPDGILLSNGPGDPKPLTYIINTIKNLMNEFPIFGICLGQQLLGLALGGKIFKLKFGHHGSNHPVKNLNTGKVEITSQNHGFCLDLKSINLNKIEITHINLNDQTIEGIRHKYLPIFSVQFHPEGSPGPHDTQYLFTKFVKMMEITKFQKNNK